MILVHLIQEFHLYWSHQGQLWKLLLYQLNNDISMVISFQINELILSSSVLNSCTSFYFCNREYLLLSAAFWGPFWYVLFVCLLCDNIVLMMILFSIYIYLSPLYCLDHFLDFFFRSLWLYLFMSSFSTFSTFTSITSSSSFSSFLIISHIAVCTVFFITFERV